MKRRFAAGLLTVCAVSVLLVFTAPAQGQAVHTPPDKEACKDGGWQSFTDETGRPFANQGQCVAWVNRHDEVVTLGDLAGTFTGTTSFEFSTAPCSFVEQVHDATYAAAPSVGQATLHIEGCVLLSGNFVCCYEGTFTLTTAVGSVSGTASGSISETLAFDLTLTVTSATGAFSGTEGQTLHTAFQWDGNNPGVITGAVTVP